MMKWFRSFLVMMLIGIFGVAMTSAQFEGGELTDGEEIEVEVDGEDTVEFTYEGSEGDFITVVVSAQDDTDTRLTLFDEDGDEVATDDDSGGFPNPALIRIELPSDGEYTFVLEEYSGEELDDEFEITLFEVEGLDLGEGPQTVELGDDFETDRMTFEAEEDVVYFIFVEADDPIDGTFSVDISEEDDFFAETRLSLSGTTGGAIVFEASDDGIVTVELNYFSFDNDDIEFTIEVSADQ